MKRTLCLLLALCMLAAMIPAVNAYPVRQNGYTINGVTVRANDFPQYAGNCWTYANALYHKVWGEYINGNFNDSHNILRNLSDAELYITPEHIKAYVTAAPVGSIIRIAGPENLHGDDSRGHSQFIVDKDEYGFTVFQANMPGISVNYYTWSGWANSWLDSRRQYIKYIKCPSGNAIQPGPLPSNVTLKASATAVNTGASVSFTFAANHADSTQLLITDHMGGTFYSGRNPKSPLSFTFTKPGTYSAVYHATNARGTVSSPTVNITVSCVHSYGEETLIRPAGCKIKGLSVAYCTHCGIQKRTVISALEHQVGDWIDGAAPTCTSPGEQHNYCSVCGLLVGSKTIPALEHTFTAEQTPATCTAMGYTTKHCSRCGETRIEDYTDPLPHDWADGNACSACGKPSPYADGDDGHIHAYETTVTEPDCITAGTESEWCPCGEGRLIRQTAPLGHAYHVTQKDEATATHVGSAVLTCVRCGETVTQVLPALGTLTNHFEDVAEGRYYSEPVLWSLRAGITDGVTGTTFGPSRNCTRAQVVTFLWRAFGQPKANITTTPFHDVHTNSYYYNALLWAYEQGITDGTTATTFSPNSAVTRGQFVTFLWRAEGKPSGKGYTDFSDVYFEDYYFESVLWADAAGIANGVTDTTFAPKQKCTRGQVVTFLYRTYAESFQNA